MKQNGISKGDYFFTSESVGDGHPDKVADQISDAVVDRFLREDPVSRVAAETVVTTNWVAVCGEARGPDSIDAKEIERLTRETIRDIGYEQHGFHWAKAEVVVRLHKQSPDIAQGVDEVADKLKALETRADVWLCRQ
jgi:S-adenosylmethionine synthetase